MNDVLAILLFLGGMVGGILLAVYLCLLPPRLFLRGERWLTEQEFREAAPGKAWCRHMPAVALVAGEEGEGAAVDGFLGGFDIEYTAGHAFGKAQASLDAGKAHPDKAGAKTYRLSVQIEEWVP